MTSAPAGPTARGSATDLLLLVAAAWLGVLVLLFVQLWLATWLWVLVLAVDALVGVAVVAVAAVAVGGLARRRRPVLAAVVGLATAALLVSTVVLDWRPVYAHGWFALHRPGFTEIADLARSGSLVRTPSGHYDLPGTLGLLSVDGEASWCGRSVLLVPALLRAPDGGAGFVHVPDDYSGGGAEGFCDANGDQVQRRVPLGGGWWWAD